MITGGAAAINDPAMILPHSNTSARISSLMMPTVSTIWSELYRYASG